MWRDDAADCCSGGNCPNLRLFLTQCYVCEVSVLNQSKHVKVILNGVRKARYFNELDGIDEETDGIRVAKFPRIHHVGNSQRDSKDDDY